MLRICTLFVLTALAAPVLAVSGPEGTIRVIDADTWDVGGQRVRLFGIDAPEMSQSCDDAAGRVWKCGRWATVETRALYGGAQTRCERIDIDRYGRIVARCFVDGRDAGRELVRSGIVLAYRRYSTDYVGDERAAAADRRGMHSGNLQTPAAYRHRPAPGLSSEDGCRIKGNISSSGERIYHVPGQRDYARTVISPTGGEGWFCSASQARLAGWRPARR